MADIPIHTGQWIDWSHGAIFGKYRTCSVEETQYIISGTGAFLTYVGGCTWLIYAFVLHRILSTGHDADLVTLQHRSIYRNDSTPLAAAGDALWVYWSWKAWSFWPLRRRQSRTKRIGVRTCAVLIPTFIIFGFFASASVLSSRIAPPPYKNQTVLISNGFNQNRCGIRLSAEVLDENASNFTRAALSYARSCYPPVSPGISSTPSIPCSFYAATKLNYARDDSECPFGDENQGFNESICNFNGNDAAYRVTTALLDSHNELGINAPVYNRLKLVKELTCSPLSQRGFTSQESDSRSNTYYDYNYGGVPGIQSYTYRYIPTPANASISPQILYAGSYLTF
jgi:hypothetical protein